MRRALARPLAGVILAAAVLSLAVPSVGAGPLFPPGGTHKVQVDWISAAWAWLGELWGWDRGAGVTLTQPQATDNTEVTRFTASSSSCLDPNGVWIPCSQLVPPPYGILWGPVSNPLGTPVL